MAAVIPSMKWTGSLALGILLTAMPFFILGQTTGVAIDQTDDQPMVNLTAIPHPFSIELVWSKVNEDDQYGNYALDLTRYEDIMSYKTSNVPMVVRLPLNATRYVDLNITSGSIYYYHIDVLSNSQYYNFRHAGSNEIYIRTTAIAPPAPTIMKVEPRDCGAFLKFSIPENDGGCSIVNFTVFSGRDPGNLSPLMNFRPYEIYNLGGCTVYGLENGIDNYLAVKTVNLIGPSDLSDITLVKPLPAPSDFKATAKDDGAGFITVNVTWQPPKAGYGNVTGYILTEYGLTANPRGYSFAPEQRNYSMDQYFFGGSLSYRVEALYEDGNVSYSNTTILGPFAMYEGLGDGGLSFLTLTILSVSIVTLVALIIWWGRKGKGRRRSK